MDIGTILIFTPLAIYCFYSFRKSKLDIYLMLGTLSWYGIFYPGKHNLYQFLQQPLKTIINLTTMLLLLRIFTPLFIPYLKKSIQDYKEYKVYKEYKE